MIDNDKIEINDAVTTPHFRVGQVNEITLNGKGIKMAKVRKMGSSLMSWFRLEDLTLLWHTS